MKLERKKVWDVILTFFTLLPKLPVQERRIVGVIPSRSAWSQGGWIPRTPDECQHRSLDLPSIRDTDARSAPRRIAPRPGYGKSGLHRLQTCTGGDAKPCEFGSSGRAPPMRQTQVGLPQSNRIVLLPLRNENRVAPDR